MPASNCITGEKAIMRSTLYWPRDSAVALEVNSGVKQRISGLGEFKKRFPDTKIYLVGDDGISIEEFLKINPNSLF
jgi:hypothetical protein